MICSSLLQELAGSQDLHRKGRSVCGRHAYRSSVCWRNYAIALQAATSNRPRGDRRLSHRQCCIWANLQLQAACTRRSFHQTQTLHCSTSRIWKQLRTSTRNREAHSHSSLRTLPSVLPHCVVDHPFCIRLSILEGLS